jgi:hypothetical protein
VSDGRTQITNLNTYASTPTRPEFLLFLHLIAHYDFDFWHLDVTRAFLTAHRTDPTPLFAKIRGSRDIFKVNRAIYGLRTSPRDFQNTVVRTMKSLSFQRLTICDSIYLKKIAHNTVYVLCYVDDFLFTGDTTELVIQELFGLILHTKRSMKFLKSLTHSQTFLGDHAQFEESGENIQSDDVIFVALA